MKSSIFGGQTTHAGGCLKILFCWISAHRIPTIDCVDTGDSWNILESCCPSLEARNAVQLTVHFLLTCHLSTSNYPLLGLFQQGPPMPPCPNLEIQFRSHWCLCPSRYVLHLPFGGCGSQHSQPLLVQQHGTLETSGEHLTKPRVTRRNL